MTIVKNISFQTAGYGHVKVSALVNDKEVYFTTDDMRMTDAAKDEDDERHEEAMQRIVARLEEIAEFTA